MLLRQYNETPQRRAQVHDSDADLPSYDMLVLLVKLNWWWLMDAWHWSTEQGRSRYISSYFAATVKSITTDIVNAGRVKQYTTERNKTRDIKTPTKRRQAKLRHYKDLKTRYGCIRSNYDKSRNGQ